MPERLSGPWWTRHEARPERAAALVSLGCELSVDEVYRDPLAG